MKRNLIPLTVFACAIAGASLAQSPILGLQSVDVIRGWRQADGTHMAAVHIKLDKNWKTYWRVAGGGGIPPQFDWSGSQNIAAAQIKWPAPRIYKGYGLRTIGYQDELVLPIQFHPIDATQPMRISGTIDFGICEDVCVPVRSDLNADLPPRVAVGKTVIQNALKAQAKPASAKGITVSECAFKPIEDGVHITAKLKRPNGFNPKAIGVIEYPSGANSWINQEPSKASGNGLTIQASIYSDDVIFIDRSKLRMTVLANNQAFEINGCAP